MTAKTTTLEKIRLGILLVFLAWGVAPAGAQGMMSMIDGITNTTINLTARDGHISTGDGNSIYIWGLAPEGSSVQYPAPTIIARQGTTLQINLTNQLTVPVSLLFPGQTNIVVSGGVAGAITREAQPAGGVVSYTFTVGRPGTYTYYSGTRPDLQIEMGIVGALIVRPVDAMGSVMEMQAYDNTNTMFDHEFLFLLTEMDENIHDLVEQGRMTEVDTTTYFPSYWFINGRTGPDTMFASFVPWLPTQPYNCLPMFHPGENVLMRVIGGGRDSHPLHHHGNNSTIIARDGRMLESNPGVSGPDLAQSVFTIPSTPGGTVDALFTWTGAKLGWDVYGHMASDPMAPNEYAPDHGKPFPVTLPNDQQSTYGQHYGGSPFLGTSGVLPPGNGGFNAAGAFMFMWHSHNEKEICNNNVFPGGMMTMAMVEATTNSMPMP